MPDITTRWSPTALRGDWVLLSTDLAAGDDLITSVIISLFTWRRALASDPIPPNPDGTPGDLRGYWADTGSPYPWGSRLYLLWRRKSTPDVPGDAKDYCTEALQWMLDDGVVGSIAVDAFYLDTAGNRTSRGTPRLGIMIVLARSGGPSVTILFAWAWQQQIGS